MTEPLPPGFDDASLSAEEFDLMLRFLLDGPDALMDEDLRAVLVIFDRPVDNPVEEG